MNVWQTIAAVVAAYLLGSISFAWLFAKKLEGVDLRTFGSGNLGATNAGRLLGRRFAILIYLLDFAKGFVPVFLLRVTAGDPLAPGGIPVSLLAGLASFLGHCFPVWHEFRGGKGVATASGVIFGLTPLTACCVIGVFVLVVGLFRIISLGSIAAAIALPVAHLLIGEGGSPAAIRWTRILYTAMALLVVARHHRNVGRLMRGEEPRIGARKG
jgi:glycerol-3-phosphate acyltransferase PlsY